MPGHILQQKIQICCDYWQLKVTIMVHSLKWYASYLMCTLSMG